MRSAGTDGDVVARCSGPDAAEWAADLVVSVAAVQFPGEWGLLRAAVPHDHLWPCHALT